MFDKNHRAKLLVALALLAICLRADAALRLLGGHVPAVVRHLTPVGRLAATNRLDLAIGLPLRNQAALRVFLKELYDPASTNFHHYLTPEQFTARFSPTEQDYQAVIDFARANGLAVTHTHGNRVLLDVTGKVVDIEKAFHITLRTYRHPTEPRNFFAPDTEPSVVEDVPVLDISGLSDYGKPRPFLHARPSSGLAQPAAGSGPNGGYIGTDFRTAYVPGTTLDGSGQMVGLFQLTGYDPNDVFAYEAQAGLPDVPLQNVLVDGYSGAIGSGEDETCLDIEMAISMATNLAAVVVFEGPNNTAYWNDVLNTMASSNQIKQFSSSWGFSGGPSQTSDQIFQQMAAQGQSFFQASGDGDAWTTPIWEPAESPYLTVVGGTTLSMTGSGRAYLSERVWNWGNTGMSWGLNGSTNDYWGSGGGVSANYPIPDWQSNVDMTANLGSTTMRNIPDVALAADNIYVTHGSGQSGNYGGTSCAAPLWAAFMALVNQQAAGMNQPSVGFLNPAIYAMGNGTNYTACFHDTTTGDNTWSGSTNEYFAVPGYDLCTGWGTPSGTNLINALVGLPDPLVISPQAGFVAVGAGGGSFNGTAQSFNLYDASAASLNWSLINTSSWFTISQSAGTLAAGCQTGVNISLATAADGLVAGCYTATVFFTNSTTQIAQPRTFTLQVGQSLVQDGGFESGTFSRWTLAGNTITNGYIYNAVENPADPTVNNPNVAHSGNYGAFLGDTQLAVLSQVLPTCPGQTYLLSFWLDNPLIGSSQFFEANWNTNGADTNTIYSLPNPPAFSWTNLNFVLVATGTNTTLQFGAENPPSYFGLDDISVVPIPPPVFSAVTESADGCEFTWTTLTNVTYAVQYTTNLSQPNWLNLGDPITATADTLTVLDTNTPFSSPQGFYRVVVWP